MVQMKARTTANPRRVIAAVRKGTVTSLGHAGAYLRGIAKRSIKVSPHPAPPGHQPHTRKGKMKKAIFYAVERAQEDVVIGPVSSEVGKIGGTHEFGGVEPPKKKGGKARKYPPRPFMGPALAIGKERLPSLWANSIKGG